MKNNKNNRCYFYFCLFQCASFLYGDPHFWPSFPSAWRISFNIFCGLWVMNALSFAIPRKSISSSFWKNNFTRYRILGYWSFYFNVLSISFRKKEKKISFIHFLPYGFWWESSLIFNYCSSTDKLFFSLCFFQDFTLPLIFCSLNMICIGVIIMFLVCLFYISLDWCFLNFLYLGFSVCH